MESSIFPTSSLTPTSDFSWLLRNIEYPDSLLGDAANSMESGLIFLPDFSVPRNTLSLVQGSNTQIAHVFRGLTFQLWRDIRPSIDKTMLLLPEQTQQELQEKPYDVVCFRLIIFLLMNNFTAGSDAVFENLFRQLQQFSISQIENLLDMVPYPYSMALEQSILTIAIEGGAVSIVRVLMDRGMDPNTGPHSPFNLACRFHQVEITQILVKAGADVNNPFDVSAIYQLFSESFIPESNVARNHGAVVEIFRLLLVSGAGIGRYDLTNTLFWKDEELVDTFLKHATPWRGIVPDRRSHRTLMCAIRNLDQDRGFHAAKLLLGTEFELGHLKIDSVAMSLMQNAAQFASFQGNESLVKFFLAAGVPPTGAWLALAVRGNSIPIVRRLLREGVKATEVVHLLSDTDAGFVLSCVDKLPANVDSLLKEHPVSHKYTTPFAESIRCSHEKLCQIFLDLDALNEKSKLEEIVAALIAASEVGDLERVRCIITLAKTSMNSTKHSFFRFGWEAGSAIMSATIGNHEQIVTELLQAGIQLDNESITAAILIRNIGLLRLFLDIGTQISSQMSGHISLAIRWGNLDAVRLLIEAGAPLHETGWSIPFLNINPITHHQPSTPLGEAIARGDERLIDLLLENGASANLERLPASHYLSPAHYQSPLYVAVKSGNESIVRKLLLRGAEPCDSLALLVASSQSTMMMQILLRAFDAQYPAGKNTIAPLRSARLSGIATL